VGKRDVAIKEVEAVGHYAIRPTSPTATTPVSILDSLYDLGARQDDLLAALPRPHGGAARAATQVTPAADERQDHFGFEQVAPRKGATGARVFESVAGSTT